MFDHDFITILTNNMEKMGFGLDYAKEVMDMFDQLTKQASQDNLHEIENFFLRVQNMVKEMMTHINELQRNEVISIVT